MKRAPLIAAAVTALAALLSATSWAQSNPWPFDFDSSLAADPAAIDSKLAELGAGVPPIPAGDLEPTQVGPVTLYFHADMLGLLELAYASGPGLQEYFQRDPAVCAEHAAFVFPDILVDNASFSCQALETQIRAAFDDDGQSCLRVEFPELYIYDQPPGEADHDDLQTLEGLIRIVGEVFTHIDYPTDLLPAGFELETRTIIAKVRYPTLLADLRARRSAYLDARSQLEGSPECFEAGAAASLLTTIDLLLDELDDAEQRLEGIYADGLAQAAADRAAVEDQGRLRGELPHPALTDRERELLALYIGGIYWRMRGEALLAYPESGLLRRFIYVQYPYQVIADISGGADGADLGRDIFINETWGYADWMDMGRSPGNDKYSDLVDMSLRGKRTLDLAEPHLAERGYDTAYLFSGGLQMGPCYYYGWEPLWEPDRFFQLGEDLTDPYVWFLECPTAHGEFCTGAALGLGLARTLLRGKPGPVPPADAGTPDAEIGGPDAGSMDAQALDVAWPDAAAADAGTADAALPDDGGRDSAAPVDAGGDAGARDGAVALDSSAGTGAAADAGDSPDVTGAGCGCGAAPGAARSRAWLAIVAMAWLRRRYRRRKTDG